MNLVDDANLTKVDIPNFNLDISGEIPLVVENDDITESINAFKDSLLLTITKLSNTIDFLKRELEEKNLLVRTLLLREANGRDKIDPNLLCLCASEAPSYSMVESLISDTSSGDDNVTRDNENYYESNDTNGEELNSTLITIDREINISSEDTNKTIVNDTFNISETRSNYESLQQRIQNYRYINHQIQGCHRKTQSKFQDFPGHFSCFSRTLACFIPGLFQDFQANSRTFPGLFQDFSPKSRTLIETKYT